MTECDDLDAVRRHIDDLDVKIVELLAKRADYVAEAARFKESQEAVIVPERVEAIIAKVRRYAALHAANPDLMEAIYRRMIDAFIVFEKAKWRDLNC